MTKDISPDPFATVKRGFYHTAPTVMTPFIIPNQHWTSETVPEKDGSGYTTVEFIAISFTS